MKDLTIAILIVAFENIVAIAVWAMLAIQFQHWWIALFGLLFCKTVKGLTKEEQDEPE